MDGDIVDIIELLDSGRTADVVRGVEMVDKLLAHLLPQIVTLHKIGSVEDSASLASFIALQDDFQYNLAQHVVRLYKDVHGAGIGPEAILTCNRVLQGLLLVHPKSREIFHRGSNMRLLLQLIESSEHSIQVCISTISTLIHILLKDLKNFRVFEENNGCSILIRRFKVSSFDQLPVKASANKKVHNQQDLNFKIIEFLLFYMVDEGSFKSNVGVKTVAEKSLLFKDDFPEIDSLIENLGELNNI